MIQVIPLISKLTGASLLPSLWQMSSGWHNSSYNYHIYKDRYFMLITLTLKGLMSKLHLEKKKKVLQRPLELSLLPPIPAYVQ